MLGHVSIAALASRLTLPPRASRARMGEMVLSVWDFERVEVACARVGARSSRRLPHVGYERGLPESNDGSGVRAIGEESDN